MERQLRELKGFSGSKIYLMEGDAGVFVRKIGNVDRNYERLITLQDEIRLPKVIKKTGDVLDMEYIHGLDIKSYLLSDRPHRDLARFILDTIERFNEVVHINKNYLATYHESLSWMDRGHDLPFEKDQLIERLPRDMAASWCYHGDMTLENIIYTDRGFVFIDPVTVPYDFWAFDLAKLRQDLDCKWFLRHDTVNLDAKLYDIRRMIMDRYVIDDHLLILMLLRVYVHAIQGSFEHGFLLKEITRLWR